MKSFLILVLLLTAACKESDQKDLQTTVTTVIETPITSDDVTSADPIPANPTQQTSTEEFMTLIDDHRVSIGLSPLILDEGLSGLAEQHSSNMASGIVAFGHTGFATRCSEGRTLISGGNWCGENVAMGQKTPAAAFTAWMNSSGHRSNIENARATHTGFGYKQDSRGVTYWTQIFMEHN